MSDHEHTTTLQDYLAQMDWTVPTGPLDPLTGLHLEPGDAIETRIWGADSSLALVTSAESASAYQAGGPDEFCTCSSHFHEGSACMSHLHDLVRGDAVPSESQYILFCTEHQHYRHADADDLRELLIGTRDPTEGFAAMVRNWRQAAERRV